MSPVAASEQVRAWMYPAVFGNAGRTRVRIIMLLNGRAMGIGQVAREIGMSYKGVQYQMRRLERDGILRRVGDRYGVLYYLSDRMKDSYPVFEGLVCTAPSPGHGPDP